MPTQTPYAPSPSLVGANDALQRTSSRAPVISFGFGGKLVTCFHGSGTLNTGFDIALVSRQTTHVDVRALHSLVPTSALESGNMSFPGPLFADPGTPTTSLVRPGASAQIKSNKAKVLKYLEERAGEIAQSIPYLEQSSATGREAEGQLVLVRLLKVMVENDGQLSGSTKVESAVRAALVNRLGDEMSNSPSILNGTLGTLPSGTDLAMNSLGLGSDPNDAVLSTVTVRASALERIQEHLIRGDRRAAYNYALDERLWAHAMVIAGSIDRDAWKEVVNEFVKAELGGPGNKGREGLKMAYSLFSGQGAASEVQALAAPTKLSDVAARPTIPQSTMASSPSFSSASASLLAETLAKWSETIAMAIPGPSTAECSAALLALGDTLQANGCITAAHVSYLLAPQTHAIPSLGSPSGRIVLLGGRNPLTTPNFHTDHDPIIFSEIAEFALSLAPVTKGQEPFSGCTHLQVYKLLRATHLAEMGHMQAANRYCEAITSSLKSSNHGQFNIVFLEQLKELTDRLTAAPVLDKAGSWIGRQMGNRPSLDSIGGWFGDRLQKFIADDGDATTGETAPPEAKQAYGPFAHYSTISSASSSKPSSPAPTMVNPHVTVNGQLPPRRAGSSQSMHQFGAQPQVTIDRASSAMDYRPQGRSSPTPRIASANPAITTFAQSPAYYGGRGYQNGLQAVPSLPENDGERTAQPDGGSWWGSDEANSSSTPTAATFYSVEQPISSNGSANGNFVSLMDAPMFGTPAVTPSTQVKTLPTQYEADEDDDLGLGNSSRKKKAVLESVDADESAKVNAAAKQQPSRPDPKPTQNGPASSSSGSWFRGWWGKNENKSGPIKATLGEENSFYFDKDLKRWVNKKVRAGVEEAKPAASPPPPSRVQTASPGQTAARIANGNASTPPPARAQSSVDLTSPPRAPPLRARSNLAPLDTDPSLPPKASASMLMPPASAPPPPGLTPPPTPGRPKSGMGKRNVRNRYVDVFQESSS
ncbi:Sec23-binding domain of Sec16-domain-containing protein [Vararia minispora EC-137]|uniref:Sec23-binding domain of Sec16-domain-containing protein n=1 Tax=Vararia minispora EC-137 TaxID=1314806 RepID=A0ACB8QIP3_9AGAM|nr:Sec23-binding domain of Sec16-domain-containing protein [Vararia minispora EC-137]